MSWQMSGVILLFITLKIRMVYFEQLRLLIILVMAYFSYRKISALSFDAIEPDSDSLQPQLPADDAHSQLESESALEELEEEAVCEEKGEQLPNQDCQPSEAPLNQEQPVDTPQEDIVPEVEPAEQPSVVLAEVDENESVHKTAKRKMIKKTWRKEKKESATETIICCSSSELGESEAEQSKENQMIDI